MLLVATEASDVEVVRARYESDAREPSQDYYSDPEDAPVQGVIAPGGEKRYER